MSKLYFERSNSNICPGQSSVHSGDKRRIPWTCLLGIYLISLILKLSCFYVDFLLEEFLPDTCTCIRIQSRLKNCVAIFEQERALHRAPIWTTLTQTAPAANLHQLHPETATLIQSYWWWKSPDAKESHLLLEYRAQSQIWELTRTYGHSK